MKRKKTKIDWQRCCLNLRKIKPLAQFAREIGCDEQTLNRLANGDVPEPRFSVGIELLNEHFDHWPEIHKCLMLSEFKC